MYEENKRRSDKLNHHGDDRPVLAAAVFDVKGIGIRDLVARRGNVPLEGNEEEQYAAIGEFGPLFSTNRFIHLVDPVIVTLKDFSSIIPHIHGDIGPNLIELYEHYRPRELLPEHLLIPGENIVESLFCGTAGLQHVVQRLNEFELLSELLKNKEFTSRLKRAAQFTTEREVETQFNVWSDIDTYSERPKLLFGPVYLGEAFSVCTEEKWEKLKQKSQLVTVVEICREFNVWSLKEIKSLMEDNPDFKRRFFGALQNEIEILLAHKDELMPNHHPGSLAELLGSPGLGLYKSMIVHSHPHIPDSSLVEPSLADLNAVLSLRKMHVEDGVNVGNDIFIQLEAQPLSIIIQPTDALGNEVSVLIYKEVAGLPYRETVGILSENLYAHYEEHGVTNTLESLQFASVTFSFKRGRFTPKIDQIVETLKESERRISEKYYNGTRQEVTDMMLEFLLKQRQLDVESAQRWLLKQMYE